MKPDYKLIIGRREYVDFPDLQLFGIEAKIDTGAYTSALHCHSIELRVINDKQVLCFKILDPGHPEYNELEQHFYEYSVKSIKSSSGQMEERFVIKTTIVVGGKKIRCRLSLTDRGAMRYPVLIGRRLLKKSFIIDPSEIHLGSKTTKKQFIKTKIK